MAEGNRYLICYRLTKFFIKIFNSFFFQNFRAFLTMLVRTRSSCISKSRFGSDFGGHRKVGTSNIRIYEEISKSAGRL